MTRKHSNGWTVELSWTGAMQRIVSLSMLNASETVRGEIVTIKHCVVVVGVQT